ncbi:NAD+ synthase [soil metagenome]
MPRLRVALCQLDTHVGDLAGNAARIVAALAVAADAEADLAVLPELAITGYPPEDLVLKAGFVADNRNAVEEVAAQTGRCVATIGYLDLDAERGVIYNAAAVCAGGSVIGTYRKQRLPNYAVFDEERYFEPGGPAEALWSVAGVRVGVTICEDSWFDAGPMADQAAGGAELLVNLNASPYHQGRLAEREDMLVRRVREVDRPVVYVNQVGGQDELVFDGASLVLDRRGGIVARMAAFEEGVEVLDVEVDAVEPPTAALTVIPTAPSDATAEGPAPRRPVADHRPARLAPVLDRDREVYGALVLGTRDYVRQNGFTNVVVGLSGGIDSSLVAAVATDALGPAHVHGVSLPSRYSSEHSRTDAEHLAAALGIDLRTIAIETAHAALLDMLAPAFGELGPDLTEENLQSRIRGVVLMALSNKLGWLVLTTGNKSEVAVGYSTLYGDTAGGFAVIKDVLKTRVYELCRARNEWAGCEVIPESVLTKAPSAELRPGQRDDQSLPPYDVLDPILHDYVERDRTAAELLADGHDAEVVARIVRLVDLAEYKRRQSPVGVRVTPKAFGKDRRMPITNGYRG